MEIALHAVTVSIIVPCYNVAPYLDACMDSLVHQTLQDIEIICVNDGSTDDTPALLRAWEERDSRVRVIDRENGGLSVARNTGMELASGEYIGFVDPDDYVEHSMYARLLEEARRHDSDVVACGYTCFSVHGGKVFEKWNISPDFGVEEDAQSSVFGSRSACERMDIVAWNKLYKREFLERNSLCFEPSCRQAEDVLFWLMLLAHVSRLAVIPDRLYWYRKEREGALSLKWEEEGAPVLLLIDRLACATVYWKKCGWLESGLERGWVVYFLRCYLLQRLVPVHKPFPPLSREEWRAFHGKSQEWFALAGDKVDRLRILDKWETAFCRLLSQPAKTPYWMRRMWWKLLSRRGGRRGRYYTLRVLLAQEYPKK